ncbi:hypothetical protein SESBI_19911 [Sesbania bispinosa]|nr:hypothetical protein SESBI_19911 [Sesbania bispinosa]
MPQNSTLRIEHTPKLAENPTMNMPQKSQIKPPQEALPRMEETTLSVFTFIQ